MRATNEEYLVPSSYAEGQRVEAISIGQKGSKYYVARGSSDRFMRSLTEDAKEVCSQSLPRKQHYFRERVKIALAPETIGRIAAGLPAELKTTLGPGKISIFRLNIRPQWQVQVAAAATRRKSFLSFTRAICSRRLREFENTTACSKVPE